MNKDAEIRSKINIIKENVYNSGIYFKEDLIDLIITVFECNYDKANIIYKNYAKKKSCIKEYNESIRNIIKEEWNSKSIISILSKSCDFMPKSKDEIYNKLSNFKWK